MARVKLTSGTVTADGAVFETDSATAPPETFVLLFVAGGRAGLLAGAPTEPTVIFADRPMVRVNSVVSGDRRLSCFQAVALQSTTGTFEITFAEQQDFCAWSAVAYTGVNIASALVQTKAATATAAGTLTVPLGGVARNGCVAAVMLNAQGNVTPGAGLVEIDQIDTAQGALARSGTLETADAQPLVNTVAWTWAPNANAAAIVVEFKAAQPAGPVVAAPNEALIRRFEPILFLHSEEKFVPVNAKRFVEASSLWTTVVPRDEKVSWGTGQPGVFPRRPVATGLSAVSTEPGNFLGATDAGAAFSQESFLELGGWNTAALSHENGVTADTENVYADRDAVEVRYGSDLKASQFWYHAEVFDTVRLRSLSRGFDGPDFAPLIASVPRATLLCYYLFFPAHVQSVQCPSGQTSAAELASHAGDWQCVAILGESDEAGAADRFQPKFLGLTGLRPAAAPDGYPAHDFDDDEMTVMKVVPWRAAAAGATAVPQTTPSGGRLHPHVYVALGTHSLYTDAGDHAVDPFPADALPRACGKSDGVGVSPPAPKNPPDDDDDEFWEDFLKWLAVSLGKALAGAKAAATLGPGGALAGGIGGFATGIVETINAGGPFGATPPFVDVPNADTGPTAGIGITITPAGLAVPGAGPTVVTWQVGQQQSLDDSTRRYDYVVDRETQAWWPHDDNEHGFKGRWGQRVTSDTLPRRSGPRFPNYPQMFLVALADLRSK